jgi:hypothetical protein
MSLALSPRRAIIVFDLTGLQAHTRIGATRSTGAMIIAFTDAQADAVVFVAISTLVTVLVLATPVHPWNTFVSFTDKPFITVILVIAAGTMVFFPGHWVTGLVTFATELLGSGIVIYRSCACDEIGRFDRTRSATGKQSDHEEPVNGGVLTHHGRTIAQLIYCVRFSNSLS